MATSNINTALAYFRRALKTYENFDSHIWYNIDKVLDDKEIEKIRNFSIKYKSNLTIVINGIKQLRPQRTWGDLPEWFRSANEWHELHKENSAFIFMNFRELPVHDETDEEYEKRKQEYKKENLEHLIHGKYTDRTDALKARQKLIDSLDAIKKEVPEAQIIVMDLKD